METRSVKVWPEKKDLKGKGNLFSNIGGLLLRRGIIRLILRNSEVELRLMGGSDNLVQELMAWCKKDFNMDFTVIDWAVSSDSVTYH